MDVADVTLAARGQIVIPKEARDALGLKPGARLSVRVEGSCLLLEKRVALDLSRWVGKAIDDGLTSAQALTELRGRPVPWMADATPSVRTSARKSAASKPPTNKNPASKHVAPKSKAARK